MLSTPGAARSANVAVVAVTWVGATGIDAAPPVKHSGLLEERAPSREPHRDLDRPRAAAVETEPAAENVDAGTEPAGSASTSTSANSRPPRARDDGVEQREQQIGEREVVEHALQAESPSSVSKIEAAALSESSREVAQS